MVGRDLGETETKYAAGVLFQSMTGRPAALGLAPAAECIDLVGDAEGLEHDEVDEAWQMTQRMRSCQTKFRLQPRLRCQRGRR